MAIILGQDVCGIEDDNNKKCTNLMTHEEQDLDGFDPWGEPLWASRSDTRGGTAGCDSRPMLARGPAGSR